MIHAQTLQRERPILTHQLSRPMWLARHAYAALTLVVPLFGAAWAFIRAWTHGVGALELTLFAVMFSVTELAITLGYHRYLSHRAFDARPAFEVALLVFGAMASQGPPMSWAADHRRHHEFADQPGDPHSPHEAAARRRGAWAGFLHAQLGWTFTLALTNTLYYCRDLQRNARVRFVHRYYLLWVILGLALPAVAGWEWRGDLSGLLSGLLWGGFVRLVVSYHSTGFVNTVAHCRGARPFATRDQSRNVLWLALITFGEGFHNNHHAFPGSAFLGLRAGEPDIGAWALRLFAALGLVSNVKRPSARAVAARRRDLEPPPHEGAEIS